MTVAKDIHSAPPQPGWRDMTHVSFARSIWLFAIGAAIGLILAGFALFTAKGTSTLVVPPEDVALVNQQPIARSDFYLQLKTLYDTDYAHATIEQRRTVLDQMIREELFVQRGKELDEASVDPDVRNAMVAAVEQSIAADVLASQPSDATLLDYYNRHKDVYSSEGTLVVRDLVFPSANAPAAEQALKAHQNVDAVVSQFGGKDSGRVKGEEFYFASRIHLGDLMFNAVRGLAAGQATAPIQAPDGVHILYMVNNRPPVAESFDQARARVLSDYQKDAIARVQAADERFLRKRANVLIAGDMRQ
ncbi:MAG TPA: peptidyl-prolyl cis-trans isomerase [Caulobacteraceae bacterium]|nr:peptidyl-prolyl cis-trans isomerase [Caulobacteraceae bacterium]